MAGQQGIANATWDSGSSAKIRFGATAIPLQKMSPPKVDIKVDKIGAVGSGTKDYRTPGVQEVSDGNVEILATIFEKILIPRLPKAAGTEIEFPITATLSHPMVQGGLGFLYDRSRIIGLESPEYEMSEKGMIVKFPLSVMGVAFRPIYGDREWRFLARTTGYTLSAEGQALLKF